MKDFDECDAVSEKRSLGLEQPERGSFMVAGALFMVVFLMIAGLGVDVANFFNTQSKVQSIADGAALAGANAMNQFSDTPDKHKAFQAALNHIRTKQGDTYADMYDPNFKTQDGRIVITGPDRDTEGDTFYKVGVVAMGKFESYFLPRGVFGDETELVKQKAIARVGSEKRQKINPGDLECGLFFEEEFDISSNNFNKNVSPSLDVCGAANEDAEADVSGNNNELGEIHLSNCNDNYEVDGNKNSDEGCYEDAEDGVPSLKSQYETPSPYVSKNPNVIMNESNRISWDDPTNPCPGDGGDPFVQPETQSGEDLEWSDSGNPVCVAKGESEFIPKSTNNSGNNLQDPSSNGDGVIQTENGDRANIEVRGGDVQWKGGGGLHGDLYNTTGDDIEIDGGGYEFDGDIFAEGGGEIDIESNSGGNDDVFHGNVLVEDGELEVDGNNHIFNGALVTLGENDIDIMGNNNEIYGNSEGIAINATGDLDFGYNNTTVEGIIRGTEIGIDNNGGGNLSMEGMILSNQFDWEPNSGSTRVVKDTTKYSRSVLDKGKWGGTKQNPVNVPAFANVSVKLID